MQFAARMITKWREADRDVKLLATSFAIIGFLVGALL